jgi:hypothetical protein
MNGALDFICEASVLPYLKAPVVCQNVNATGASRYVGPAERESFVIPKLCKRVGLTRGSWSVAVYVTCVLLPPTLHNCNPDLTCELRQVCVTSIQSGSIRQVLLSRTDDGHAFHHFDHSE